MRLIKNYDSYRVLKSICLGFFLVAASACKSSSDSLSQSEVNAASKNGLLGVPSIPLPIPTPMSTPTASPSPRLSPSPSPSPTSTGRVYIGPVEVEKYVLKFISDAKSLEVDVLPDMKAPILEIQISSLDTYGSSVIGLCETGNNKRRVTFDPDFWNSVSDTQKELLAHHELGHCVLYRGHRSDLLSAGAYASIMYPMILSSSTYSKNVSYYVEELFTWSAVQLSGAERDENTVHICDQDRL